MVSHRESERKKNAMHLQDNNEKASMLATNLLALMKK